MGRVLDTLDVEVTVSGDQPITVPEAVRQGLELEDGDQLRFVGENGRVFVQREARQPRSEVPKSVDSGLRTMTLDEIRANPLTITEPHSDDFDVEIEEAMEIETRRFLDRTRFGAP